MYGPDQTRIVLDAGFTRDSVEKVKTGRIKCDLAHWARWRIARPSRSRTCEPFSPNPRDGTATP